MLTVSHFFFHRLSDHAEDKSKLPILIFPEGRIVPFSWRKTECCNRVFNFLFMNSFVPNPGTCINNTSVMMFKKGSFEIEAKVYPVAIKVSHRCIVSVCCFSKSLWPYTGYTLLIYIVEHRVRWNVLMVFCPPMSQYDPRFGDAFWNSSKYGMVSYLLRMMSSWAIVCSVWYLPPMFREVSAPPCSCS